MLLPSWVRSGAKCFASEDGRAGRFPSRIVSPNHHGEDLMRIRPTLRSVRFGDGEYENCLKTSNWRMSWQGPSFRMPRHRPNGQFRCRNVLPVPQMLISWPLGAARNFSTICHSVRWIHTSTDASAGCQANRGGQTLALLPARCAECSGAHYLGCPRTPCSGCPTVLQLKRPASVPAGLRAERAASSPPKHHIPVPLQELPLRVLPGVGGQPDLIPVEGVVGLAPSEIDRNSSLGRRLTRNRWSGVTVT